MKIPNILTLIRIILIPVFVLVFYLNIPGAHFYATAIFALAAVTDWFDGYLARKLNQSSPFGAFLDPVADKLMVAAALVLMVEYYAVYWMTLPAIVIIGREIVISALREWMAEVGKRSNVAVSQIGKIKTTLQMLSIVTLLTSQPFTATAWIGVAALYGAAVLTLWSMFIYLRAAWPYLKQDI